MPKSRSQFLALEETARQPGRAPRLVLAHQSVTVEHVAGEIERVALRDIGHAKLAQPRRDRIDRKPRAPPRALRLALPDLARQLGQRHVDLVLHQRGAGGGRALRRPAAVHHDDPQSAVAQRIGHHRAGDAGADHQHVGLDDRA